MNKCAKDLVKYLKKSPMIGPLKTLSTIYSAPDETSSVSKIHAKRLFESPFMKITKDKMLLKRIWDTNCPRIWDRFDQEDKSYVIQDIPPEDDEVATDILIQYMCTDEALCNSCNLIKDQASVASIREFWTDCLSQRMSLGCYTELKGQKTLIALNVLVVDSIEDRFPTTAINGTAWRNVYHAMDYLENKCDTFKYLNLDVILHGYGVVVVREYRGQKLADKLFMARELHARAHGVRATSAVFTGPESQSLAVRCGFTTIAEATLKEFAEAGYDYPKSDHIVKLMVKKYF